MREDSAVDTLETEQTRRAPGAGAPARSPETTQGRREADILAQLTRGISESLDVDTVLGRVADAAKELCGADLSRIALREPSSDAMAFRYWPGARYAHWAALRIEPGKGSGGQALASGRPFRTEDYLKDPRITGDHVASVLAEGNVSELVVPIGGKDRIDGLLYVTNRSRRPFTDSDETVLLRLADHAAIAIRNARLHEETERRLRETEGLLSVAQTVGSSLDPTEIARRASRQATLLLGADSSIFFILDDSGEYAVAIAGYRVPEALRHTDYRLPVAGLPPVIKQALELGQPISSADLPRDPRFDHPAFRTTAIQPRSILFAPVLSRGRVRGAILTYWWTKSRRVTGEEIRLAQGVAGQTVLALDNASLYEQAQRALADLRAAQEQLIHGETLRALGEMAGGAAHHLNNLLAVVWGRAQLLLRAEEPGPRRQGLEVIERAARDAADVVRRLQQFARTEPGERFEPVDLNQLASEVLEMTRARWHDAAHARGVGIDVAFEAGDIPPVYGDPAALREVVMNLVLNAIDACPAGGRIALASRTEGNMVALDVKDTGVGMSEEIRRRAQEPFFTTKGVKRTGLGLSLSHGVLQRHAGELSIESAEGRGTTVTVRLPGISAREEALPDDRGFSVHGLRIMVIDDTADVRELLAETLSAQGHTVTQAAGGLEGLARLEAGEGVDLVLTDLGMPELNGWQVAKTVKSRWPHVKVGVVTGWGEIPDATSGQRETVDFIVAKPFSPEALEQAIAGITR